MELPLIDSNENFLEDSSGIECFVHRNGDCFTVLGYNRYKDIAVLKPLRYSSERMTVLAHGLKSDHWTEGEYYDDPTTALDRFFDELGLKVDKWTIKTLSRLGD